MAYIIKQKSEDFCVTEIINLDTKSEGEYSYFTLKKKDDNTLDAVQKIAAALKVPLKNIGFAGTKDKKAITEQTCSAKNVTADALQKINISGIEVKFLGKGDKPISLGAHESNHFKIVVRNITKVPIIKTKFLNYFGEQRLSTNNAVIGKLMLQKKFKEAAQQVSNSPEVAKYLQDNPSDAIGALKKLPLKTLKFYVHAYQSFLWNKLAEQNLRAQILPIIGFATEETGSVQTILESEGITARDFIIKQIPELSSEGGQRQVWAEAKNLKISNLQDDELNQGMKKIILEFTLDKGSYATEFIRQSFA